MNIGFLPRAKDITDSEFSEPAPKIRTRGLVGSLNIPNKMLFALFLCSVLALLRSPHIGLILIGVMLIISVLSKHEYGYDRISNDEVVETSSLGSFLICSIFWLPGIFFVLAGVCLFLKKYFNKDLNIPVAQMILFMFVIFGLIVLGMVIYTIGAFAAYSGRRKKCTLPVKAEPCGYTETPGGSDSYTSYPMFKYHYNGRVYRFIAKDYSYCQTVSSNKTGDFEVFINPDKPDVYYAEHLFGIEERGDYSGE